jgi:hypothetical protein
LGLIGGWLVVLTVALAQLDWAPAPRLLLALAALSIGGSGLAVLATGVAPGAIQRAKWSADGGWVLVLRNGHTAKSRLAADARCWTRLCILVWDDGTTRRTAFVTRSSVGADLFRRLRIRLRFELPGDLSPSRKM